MGQILITGGCGYIGSHIVKALSEAGENVVVFDNLCQGKKSHLLHHEELIVGDITDKSALEQVFATHQIETIMHFAALVNAAESHAKKEEYALVNALGSQKVWETGVKAGVKHFLYASSAAVYGTPKDKFPIQETTHPLPTNPYGATKLAGEQSLVALVTPPTNYLSFRFFNVGGAEQLGRLGQSLSSRAIMPRLFAVAAGRDQAITLSGNDYDTPDGTVVRDFVHVEDIANAYLLGLKYLRAGGQSDILNLGGGQAHTMEEVIKLTRAISQKPIPVVFAPRIEGDISYSLADISCAKAVLGWTPTHDLSQIVRDGYHAYVTQNT